MKERIYNYWSDPNSPQEASNITNDKRYLIIYFNNIFRKLLFW